MRALLILALCLAAVAAVPRNPQRIVGGSMTDISQYPSIAALLHSPNLNTWTQACGGSILNTRSILTAAHCTYGHNANTWRVRVGSTFASSGGIVHNAASLINHQSYNQWTSDNDVSIVRTATVIAHTNLARPASIAGSNYNLANNQVVFAAGWGTIYTNGPASEQLRHVQIWTISQDTCRQRYAQAGVTITDGMLCSGWLDVGGRDQCQLDSGGPLYHNNVVVGICSWGFGCGDPYYPGVNARVSSFTTWIQSNA